MGRGELPPQGRILPLSRKLLRRWLLLRRVSQLLRKERKKQRSEFIKVTFSPQYRILVTFKTVLTSWTDTEPSTKSTKVHIIFGNLYLWLFSFPNFLVSFCICAIKYKMSEF